MKSRKYRAQAVFPLRERKGGTRTPVPPPEGRSSLRARRGAPEEALVRGRRGLCRRCAGRSAPRADPAPPTAPPRPEREPHRYARRSLLRPATAAAPARKQGAEERAAPARRSRRAPVFSASRRPGCSDTPRPRQACASFGRCSPAPRRAPAPVPEEHGGGYNCAPRRPARWSRPPHGGCPAPSDTPRSAPGIPPAAAGPACPVFSGSRSVPADPCPAPCGTARSRRCRSGCGRWRSGPPRAPGPRGTGTHSGAPGPRSPCSGPFPSRKRPRRRSRE